MWYSKVSTLLNELNLEPKELKVLKDFVLLWSIFEADFCNNDSCILNVEQEINALQFKKSKFEVFYTYLKNRYSSNSILFDWLEFRRNDRKDFVKENLLSKNFETINEKDLILILYIIVYKFRNNYFHWLKAKYNFYNQYDNFRYANMFLVKLIKIKKESGER